MGNAMKHWVFQLWPSWMKVLKWNLTLTWKKIVGNLQRESNTGFSDFRVFCGDAKFIMFSWSYAFATYQTNMTRDWRMNGEGKNGPESKKGHWWEFGKIIRSASAREIEHVQRSWKASPNLRHFHSSSITSLAVGKVASLCEHFHDRDAHLNPFKQTLPETITGKCLHPKRGTQDFFSLQKACFNFSSFQNKGVFNWTLLDLIFMWCVSGERAVLYGLPSNLKLRTSVESWGIWGPVRTASLFRLEWRYYL